MSVKMKWAVVACATALLAAASALVGGRAGSAALAIVFSLLVVAISMRLDTRASALQSAQGRTRVELGKLREQNRELRAALKANRAETMALLKQVAKSQSATQAAIATMHKQFKDELQQLVVATSESEVRSGLAALNRYTALASQTVNPPVTSPVAEEGDPVHGS